MIWVTGGRGVLGLEVGLQLSRQGFPFVVTGSEVDIASPGAVERFALGHEIQWIVNCAAYTNVDRAEEEPKLCEAANSKGPEVLGQYARRWGCRVVHVSTDFVFDGTKATPYVETDAVNPLSVYGRTKAEGEVRLLDVCPEAVVMRTGWLYGSGRPGFPGAILGKLAGPGPVSVVNDQWGSPTWARDVAEFLADLLETNPLPGGIYHLSAEGQASRFEWARAIAGPRADRIVPRTTDPLAKAVRPRYSVLSKEKIRLVFGRTLPSWEVSLSKFLRERNPV